nr:Gag-Pol polyprotein [Tanacetum cinerariifolium]
MKEKGDECIFVGYSTQSRAYRVFNKRTRVIMESIHVNFDELPQMASAHNSSDPAPTCQTMASVQISSDPAPECQTMEKGDECIFVGYSNQSKAYRVFNKRTRVIMESIHVNFDEFPQMASDQNSSDPAPECQTMALNHDSLSLTIQRQANVSQADRTGRQLESDAEMRMFALSVSRTEPKNIKEAWVIS